MISKSIFNKFYIIYREIDNFETVTIKLMSITSDTKSPPINFAILDESNKKIIAYHTEGIDSFKKYEIVNFNFEKL